VLIQSSIFLNLKLKCCEEKHLMLLSCSNISALAKLCFLSRNLFHQKIPYQMKIQIKSYLINIDFKNNVSLLRITQCTRKTCNFLCGSRLADCCSLLWEKILYCFKNNFLHFLWKKSIYSWTKSHLVHIYCQIK